MSKIAFWHTRALVLNCFGTKDGVKLWVIKVKYRFIDYTERFLIDILENLRQERSHKRDNG